MYELSRSRDGQLINPQRPVGVKHDAQMHHGQSRGKPKNEK